MIADTTGFGAMQLGGSAGIQVLEARLRELANPSDRLAAGKETVVQIAENLRFWLSPFHDSRRRKLSRW
jgi:hypothetical protein